MLVSRATMEQGRLRQQGGEGLPADTAGGTWGKDPVRPSTVLLVEDDVAVRASTADILRQEGFIVLEVADAAAANWRLADKDVDVVVLDLHLARLDGTAVLESLEEGTTVIVVSAFDYFDEPRIRQDFGDYLFECLRKPVAPPRLLEVVSAAAAQSRDRGTGPRVRPIESRAALRLAFTRLADLTARAEPEDGSDPRA